MAAWKLDGGGTALVSLPARACGLDFLGSGKGVSVGKAEADGVKSGRAGMRAGLQGDTQVKEFTEFVLGAISRGDGAGVKITGSSSEGCGASGI